MLCSIYCYSGTGNSLWVAKKVSEKLANCQLFPITKFPSDTKINIDTKIAGLIFPVHI